MQMQSKLSFVAGSLALAIGLMASSHRASAQTNGTWTKTASGGLWSAAANWSGGSVASGTGATADFSTLDITSDNTVHLNSSFTVGQLAFGDLSASNNWTLDNNANSANVLTLAVASGTPTITVNNQTATISAVVAGSQGLAASGAGTLVLSGANTYGGGTTINSGARLVAANTSALGTGAVTLNGGTLRVTAAGGDLNLAGFGGSGTGWTVNSDNIASSPFPAADVLQLTDNNANQARSAFYNTPVPIVRGTTGFSTSFIYTPSGNLAGEGIAFVLQNDSRGSHALDGVGGGLGYGFGASSNGNGANGMAPSFAILLNINPSAPGGIGVQFGFYGETPANINDPSYLYVPTTPYNVNLNNGDPISFQITYNPATLAITFTVVDTLTQQGVVFGPTALSSDLGSILTGSDAYVGFAGSTGTGTSTQQISNFTYTFTGAAPVALANGVILTAGTTSTIEVGTTAATAGVSMGPLTVSSGAGSSLNVTAAANYPSLIPFSLTLGAVALNANVTFNVANNTAGGGNSLGTLRLGPISDGGQPHSITMAGPGALVLSAPATSLVAGTQFSITGGSLNADAAGAMGTAAQVGIASGGTLNVDANQTIAAFEQRGGQRPGTVVLNGATLTIGGGAGSNFSGVVTDGVTAGALKKVGADSLTLSGVNPFSGGATIAGGTLISAPAAPHGAPPVGNGPISLTSGTLALHGQYTPSIAAGLLGKYYLGAPSDGNIDSIAGIRNNLGYLTPNVTAQSTVGGYTTFNFGTYMVAGGQAQGDFGPNTGDPTDFGYNSATGTAATNFTTVWTGQFSAPSAGSYTFGTYSDDGSALYIDPNNDGHFIQVVSNLSTHAPTLSTGSITLSAGLHDVLIAYYQATGGYYMSAQVALNGSVVQGTNDVANVSDPTQMGFLVETASSTLASSQVYANSVVVTGDAAIDVSGSLAATLGPLSIGGNTLSLTSADTTTGPYSLTVGAVTLTGNATFNVANSTGGGPGTLRVPSRRSATAGTTLVSPKPASARLC